MFKNLTYVLIPEFMQHSNVVQNIDFVESAGFVDFSESKENQYGETFLEVTCFGESISLRKKAIEEDAIFINRSLRRF